MCTVTIVPLEHGFRLSCNRDERRDRQAALPPIVHTIASRQAIFPVDPISQGTWVGVNDAGLAMALLNRASDSLDALDDKPRVSRGNIIPGLLACRSPDEALERCLGLDAGTYERFRVLIVQDTTGVIVTSDTRTLSHEVVSLSRPIMETSSALGDVLVEGPRRQLFEQLFNQPRCSAWLRAQRHFHQHQWPARPEISVMMERADARTVSQTVIDVQPRTIKMAYREVGCPHAFDGPFSRGFRITVSVARSK